MYAGKFQITKAIFFIFNTELSSPFLLDLKSKRSDDNAVGIHDSNSKALCTLEFHVEVLDKIFEVSQQLSSPYY